MHICIPSHEIHWLGPNEFISSNWFPYCNPVKSLKMLHVAFIFLFSICFCLHYHYIHWHPVVFLAEYLHFVPFFTSYCNVLPTYPCLCLPWHFSLCFSLSFSKCLQCLQLTGASALAILYSICLLMYFTLYLCQSLGRFCRSVSLEIHYKALLD